MSVQSTTRRPIRFGCKRVPTPSSESDPHLNGLSRCWRRVCLRVSPVDSGFGDKRVPCRRALGFCRLRCRTTALCDAARQGNTESLKSLLATGVDVHGKNSSDGYVCLGARRQRLLSLCLDHKLVRHNRRRNGVENLATSGETDWGIWAGVQPGRPRQISAHCRQTALHLASQNGHTESVKALLEKGAAVNAEDNSKCAFLCLLYSMGDGCPRRQRLRLTCTGLDALAPSSSPSGSW